MMRRSTTGLTDVSASTVVHAPPPPPPSSQQVGSSGRYAAGQGEDEREAGPSRRHQFDWKVPLSRRNRDKRPPPSQTVVDDDEEGERRAWGVKKRSDVDRAMLHTDWRQRPLYAIERRRSLSPTPERGGSKDWRDILADGYLAAEEAEDELDAEEAIRLEELEEAQRAKWIEELTEERRWNDTRKRRPLKTGVAPLDDVLASITTSTRHHVEIIGPPSSGKTSMAIRIAVVERLDSLWDLSEGKRDELGSCWREASKEAANVTILDTEGSLTASRILQVAAPLVKARLKTAHTSSTNKLLRTVLAGIRLTRITTLYELTAALRSLCPKDYAKAQPLARRASNAMREEEERRRRDLDAMSQTKSLAPHTSLVIIDSLSFLFRAPPSKDATISRARLTALEEVRDFARRAVQKRGLAIAFTNQMAFKVVSREGNLTTFEDRNGTSRLFAALANRDGQTGSTEETSFMGPQVSRLLLFRAGSDGSRFIKVLGHDTSWISYVWDRK